LGQLIPAEQLSFLQLDTRREDFQGHGLKQTYYHFDGPQDAVAILQLETGSLCWTPRSNNHVHGRTKQHSSVWPLIHVVQAACDVVTSIMFSEGYTDSEIFCCTLHPFSSKVVPRKPAKYLNIRWFLSATQDVSMGEDRSLCPVLALRYYIKILHYIKACPSWRLIQNFPRMHWLDCGRKDRILRTVLFTTRHACFRT
jgi:hypothetical protein